MDLSVSKRDRMLSLVEQWRNSGQSRKDFCSFHGIKVCTFGYWVKQSEEQHLGVGFKQILPSSDASNRVDIIYPNGVKVSANGDLGLISRLIHLY